MELEGAGGEHKKMERTVDDPSGAGCSSDEKRPYVLKKTLYWPKMIPS